jgi:DNA polymerase/3'-5' exonuclease PolX
MTEQKQRFRIAAAMAVADEILRWLDPSCFQTAVAGSIRRGKPMVSDVEILFIPRSEKQRDPADMFGWLTVNLADQVIAQMEKAGVLARRKSITGTETYGKLNKLMIHRASGIPVDLFTEPSANDWWRSLVIRTGPKELNIRLIETAARYGVKVHAYGVGLTREDGSPIVCTSEEEFFDICGVPFIAPKARL